MNTDLTRRTNKTLGTEKEIFSSHLAQYFVSVGSNTLPSFSIVARPNNHRKQAPKNSKSFLSRFRLERIASLQVWPLAKEEGEEEREKGTPSIARQRKKYKDAGGEECPRVSTATTGESQLRHLQ